MAQRLVEASPPTLNEVEELAVAEGHDADIPTNLGVLDDSEKNSVASKHVLNVDHSIDLEKNIDSSKGTSLSEESVEETTAQGENEDPDIVWWDGPDDPQNPMNWSPARKWGAVVIVSVITLLSSLASSMFAPGIPGVMRDFNSDNDMLASFVVSVFVLGFAFGPLVVAPLSEMYGRLPLYHICNVLFIIFTVACAVSSNLNMLIAFRFLSGAVGAAPLALGGGTIADLMSREQRGNAMTVWMMGPTIGPVIGPIAGGFLSEAAGWRWVFWCVAIAVGVFTIFSFIMMRETYAVAILARKAAKLRAQTGNPRLKSKLDSGLSPKDLFLHSIVRPTKMLFRSPIVASLSTYVAVVYAYLYILFTTFATVFATQYGMGPGVVGLCFIGIGIGSLIGQFVSVYVGNRIMRKHLAAGDLKPEHRLPLMIPGALAVPVGLFWYGWSVHAHTHWIVPIIGTGLVGFGLLLTFMPANTYLVDVFTAHAASAMAANTVLRSVVAAVLPLAGRHMYDALGLGWGNSLLGFIALLFAPIPFVFLRYGEFIRTRYTVKL